MPLPPNALNSHGFAYRPGIDGLRAIAVLGVVFYHAGFGPPGGFIGVDIFFVISGYLITTLLERELATTGRIEIAAFYARRIRRLLPALGVVLAATLAASFAFLSPYGELTAALKSAGASLVFAANLYFQYTTGGYFGPDVRQLPLLHLWSLGVEEQYYLFWPLALIAARRFDLRLRRATFALLLLGSLAFAEWTLSQGSQAAFYAMPSRWWELSLGALVAWTPSAPYRAGIVEGWVGLILAAVAMWVPAAHFPGIGALPATLAAALILHASGASTPVGRLLASRPMVFIGQVSYPFYLWHWPLLAFSAVIVPGSLPWTLRASLVAASFALAVCTWRMIERPLRHVRTQEPRRLTAATLLACLTLAFALTRLGQAVITTPPPTDPASRAALDSPPNRIACHGIGLKAPVMPDEAQCELGHGPVTIALWGDSHAMAMQPFARILADREHTGAIGLTRDACAPAMPGYDNGKFSQEAAGCKAFNAMAFKRAAHMDTVILAANWPAPNAGGFADQFARMVDALAPQVRRILIIGPTPYLPASVPDCLRTNDLAACTLTRNAFMAKDVKIRSLLTSQSAQHPNVIYVDPADFFCGETSCGPVRNGTPLYWDTNHVSSRASTEFAKLYFNEHPLL